MFYAIALLLVQQRKHCSVKIFHSLPVFFFMKRVHVFNEIYSFSVSLKLSFQSIHKRLKHFMYICREGRDTGATGFKPF